MRSALPTQFSLVAVLASSFASGRDLAAQGPFLYQYAAKVVCGTPKEPAPVTVQAYGTSINVNNPSADSLLFLRKRLVITFPPGFQIPQKPLTLFNDSLPPAFALMTDCQDLRRRNRLRQPFFEGFVVIQSTMPLDVTAVYSVPGGIDVVPVAERKVFVGR